MMIYFFHKIFTFWRFLIESVAYLFLDRKNVHDVHRLSFFIRNKKNASNSKQFKKNSKIGKMPKISKFQKCRKFTKNAKIVKIPNIPPYLSFLGCILSSANSFLSAASSQ